MFHRPRTESDDTAVAETESAAPSKPEAFDVDKQPFRQENKNLTEEKTMSKEEKSNSPRPLDIPGQGSYQPQPSPRVPGAYNPGAYTSAPGAAGTSSAGAGASSASQAAGQGRRLIIGQGITMSGEIESCDYLVVEGTVEAALKGAKVLDISETGTFYGTVEINEATVAGRFEGDITCNGRLTITSSGSITGTIAYKELAIEAGATLDGKVSPLTEKAASKADKAKEARGKTDAAARNDNKDDELPFSGTSAAAAE